MLVLVSLQMSYKSLKPLSHQLATSGDALATNNFGHIANASPCIARYRQYIAITSSDVVSRRERFVKLGDCFGSEYGIVKRSLALRQPSPRCSSSSPMRRHHIVSVFADELVTMHWQLFETLS